MGNTCAEEAVGYEEVARSERVSYREALRSGRQAVAVSVHEHLVVKMQQA